MNAASQASPATGRLPKILAALGLGFIGGAVAAWLQLPLPWMMGALWVTMAAALCGANLVIVPPLRRAVLSIMGLYLGTTFSPEALTSLRESPASLSMMLVFVAVIIVLLFVLYKRFLHMDAVTSFCSAAPGGLALMLTLAQGRGSDERLVALVQTIRVVFVVVTVPLVVRFATDGAALPVAPVAQSAGQGALAWGISGAIFAVGIGAGLMLRRPAAFMLAPMVLSAALHVTGIVQLVLPPVVINAALLVLGASIGVRFCGVRLSRVADVGLIAAGGSILLLALTFGFSWLAALSLDVPYLVMLLALAPGGIAEMCLIAIAFGVDPPFVALHHLARISLLLLVAPAIVAALAHRQGR